MVTKEEGAKHRADADTIARQGGLAFAGKTVAEMTLDELRAAVLYYRDAAVDATARMAKMVRRMSKLEEAVPKDQVKRLDDWLKAHPHDTKRGDGADYQQSWQKWNPPAKEQ